MAFERRKPLLAAIVALALAALSILGFRTGRSEAARESGSEAPVQPPERVTVRNGERVVLLTPAVQRASGIETVTLRNTLQPKSLRAYGAVLSLRSLTELANNYATANAQLETARARLAASEASFERAKSLYQDQQNVSVADVQAAQAAYHTDAAGLAAARSLLETLAVSAQQDWGPVLGKALTRAAPLLSHLTSHRDVLVQVTLRPDEIADPLAGVTFAEREKGTHVVLTLISAANQTDPRIQGPSYFFTAPAASGLLPGMSLVAHLPVSRGVRGVVIPTAAIVWAQGDAWAYFRSGMDAFVRHAIPTLQPAPSGGYVVTGEPDNVQVVTRGAQMLLSEEFRAQIQVSD